MKKITLFVFAILLTPTLITLLAQSEKKYKWIEIQVFQQSKGGQLGAVKEVLYYDFAGDIRRIEGQILNPVLNADNYQYFSRFIYNSKKELVREELFEIDRLETRLKRYTTYHSENDCILVEVRNGTSHGLIGKFQNCDYPREEKMIKTIEFDNVLQLKRPRWADTQVIWKYGPDGRPQTLRIVDKQQAMDYQYQFLHFWNSSHINTMIYQKGKLIGQNNEKRDYGDAGRLTAIKYGKKEEKTGIYIKYRKSGLLKEIKHIGMMVPPGGSLNDPGTYSWNRLIFRVKVPRSTTPQAIEKINGEILSLYLPASGRLMDLNFDDSRRYLQHRG